MTVNSTKKKIIDTMYKLIATEGYEKASIGKICSEIGLTKPAVYYYFKSKEDIFLWIVEIAYSEDYSLIIERIKATKTATDYKQELLNIGFEVIDSYKDNPELQKICAEIDLQTCRISKCKKIVDEYILKTAEFYQMILEYGISIGAFTTEFDVKTNAENLHTVFLGLDTAILYNVPVDAKKIWRLNIEKMF